MGLVDKLLPLAIVIGGAVVWAVGDWTGSLEPYQQAASDEGAHSIQVRGTGQNGSAASHLGGASIDEIDPAAAPAANVNVTNSSQGHAATQDGPALSEAANAAREAKSIHDSPDGEGDVSDRPSDGGTPLSISGWVQNDAGEPVAGIQVVASARQLFGPKAGGKPGTGQSRQTARTNDEGYFALAELADGEYSVSTEATPEYRSAKAALRAGVDSAVLVVKGGVPYTVTIDGTVSSGQGQPLAGVRVRAPGAAGVAASGGDGRYTLALGIRNRDQSYSVRFTKKGYRSESRKLDGAALKEGGKIALDVALDPVDGTAAVNGTVTDLTGAAVPDARIRLSSSQLQRTYTARSDHAGVFTFPEVDIGDDYRLWVRPRSDYEEYIEEPISIGMGGANLPVTLKSLGSSTLQGQMVGADGTPVPNFSLWLRTASPSEQPYRMVTGDQRGRFKVDDLPEGEISFATRSSPALQVTGVQLSPGYQNTVELWLDLGFYEAGGYVTDSNGDPVAGSRVTLTWSIDEGGVRSRSRRSTVTGAGGSFLFTQVGPGWHTLTVEAPGYRPTSVEHYVSSGEEVVVDLQEDSS